MTRNHCRTSNLVPWISKGHSRYFCTTHLLSLIRVGSPSTSLRIWPRRFKHLIPRRWVYHVSQGYGRYYVKCLTAFDLSPLPRDLAPGLIIQTLCMPSMSSCGHRSTSLCSMALQHATKWSLVWISAPSLSKETGWDTEELFALSVSFCLTLYLLNDKVVTVKELCPLLLGQWLWCLQTYIYVTVLSAVQEVLAYFKCTVDQLRKEHWSTSLFVAFPLSCLGNKQRRLSYLSTLNMKTVTCEMLIPWML